MSQGELRDQYGTKVGSYEQVGKDYVIRDKHGFKVGTANKEFLSDNYTVRDNQGSFAYRVEKTRWAQMRKSRILMETLLERSSMWKWGMEQVLSLWRPSSS